jgi:hypothetical protein
MLRLFIDHKPPHSLRHERVNGVPLGAVLQFGALAVCAEVGQR